jgi:tocopherol O-methyltransferase
MKPRGVVAIIDLFLAKSELDQEEMAIYHKTIEGWAIPQFSTVPDFWDHLAEAGFGNIRFQDLHSEIQKSSRRMYFQKLLWAPFDFVASRIGGGGQNLSAKYQKAFFDRGIGTYGAFLATKL